MIGCDPVIIDVKLPDGSAKMVVNSFFAADSAWKVGVIRGQHVLYPKQEQEDVLNARVRITEDGEELTTLVYRRQVHGPGYLEDNGWYESDRASQIIPKPGKTYGIIIEADDYPTLTASCRIPLPVAISKVEVVSWEPDENSMIPVNVYFTDAAGEENFYEMVVGVTIEYSFSGGGTHRQYGQNLLFTHDPLYFQPSGAFDFLEASASKPGAVLFNDTGLDGKMLVVSCLVPYPSYSPDIKTAYEIILRTTSREYFQYKVTSNLQHWTDGDPFAQPVQVYTNVKDGFGIFAGYSQAGFLME
jgi:hypothetical protein